MQDSVNRIAILKSGALGDVLMTTPFLRALRQKFPSAVIDYWVGEWSAIALRDNPNVNSVKAVPDKFFHSKNPFLALKIILALRSGKYDALFILDKSYLANLLGLATGIKSRIGFDRNGEGFVNTINVKYDELKHAIDLMKQRQIALPHHGYTSMHFALLSNSYHALLQGYFFSGNTALQFEMHW